MNSGAIYLSALVTTVEAFTGEILLGQGSSVWTSNAGADDSFTGTACRIQRYFVNSRSNRRLLIVQLTLEEVGAAAVHFPADRLFSLCDDVASGRLWYLPDPEVRVGFLVSSFSSWNTWQVENTADYGWRLSQRENQFHISAGSIPRISNSIPFSLRRFDIQFDSKIRSTVKPGISHRLWVAIVTFRILSLSWGCKHVLITNIICCTLMSSLHKIQRI